MSSLERHYLIRRIKYRYCYHLDHANEHEFLDLFTDDPTFSVPNDKERSAKEELREFIRDVGDRDAFMAHMAVNPIIEIDGERAEGRWYYVVLITSGDGRVSVGQGEWEDEYQRIDGTWKISSLIARRRYTFEYQTHS